MPALTSKGYPRNIDPYLDSPPTSFVGNDLRRVRRLAGLTLDDLAQEMGLARSALSNLETRQGPVAVWLYDRHQRAIAAVVAKLARDRAPE